uniref:Integrase n=1 Tax=Solanum tuberosum TaxID=4113 RepID=M1A6U7_SOLTU
MIISLRIIQESELSNVKWVHARYEEIALIDGMGCDDNECISFAMISYIKNNDSRFQQKGKILNVVNWFSSDLGCI